jgi:hypothetical protein
MGKIQSLKMFIFVQDMGIRNWVEIPLASKSLFYLQLQKKLDISFLQFSLKNAVLI